MPRQNLGAVLVDLGRHAEARPEFQVIVAKDPGAELAWAGSPMSTGCWR